MPSVCIICHQEKSGQAVADTTVIRAIRTVKERLGMASGNTLVVCSDCAAIHADRRQKYERKVTWYLLLGLALVLLAIGLPLLTGAGLNLVSVLVMLLLAILVAALPLLDYIPPMARTPGEVAPAAGLPAPPAVPVLPTPMNWMSAAKTSPAPSSTATTIPAWAPVSKPSSKPSRRASSTKPSKSARSKPKPAPKSKSKSAKGRRR